jgi:hypothetical protein
MLASSGCTGPDKSLQHIHKSIGVDLHKFEEVSTAEGGAGQSREEEEVEQPVKRQS